MPVGTATKQQRGLARGFDGITGTPLKWDVCLLIGFHDEETDCAVNHSKAIAIPGPFISENHGPGVEIQRNRASANGMRTKDRSLVTIGVKRH